MSRRSATLLAVLIALQDRFYPSIMTVGTKIVDRLYSLSGAINETFVGRLPQFVARKLFLIAFKLDHFVAKISYQLTKVYIRISRIHYLLVQAGNGTSDFIHWRRLRGLKKRLESIHCSYGRIQRRGPMPCDVYCLLRGVYVEIHDIAVQSKSNSEYRCEATPLRVEAVSKAITHLGQAGQKAEAAE